MAAGIDYYSAGPSPASIKAAGYTAVFRYTDDPASGLGAKDITQVEYYELTNAGLSVYLVFEHQADDYAGGFLDGVINAQRALAGANWLEYEGPIFMSVDSHLAAEQIQTALDYLDGAKHILGVRLGVYGFPELIQATQVAGVGTYWWQCGDPPAPNAHVNVWQQNTGAVTVDGTVCDVDQILIPLEEDMAQVPQAEWQNVYTQLCGLFSSWAGGGTGDPNTPQYDLIQYILRMNVQLTQMSNEVAAMKATMDSLSVGQEGTFGNISEADIERVAAAVMEKMASKLGAS